MPTPEKLSDVVYRTHEYLAAMRAAKTPSAAMAHIEALESYVKEWFDKQDIPEQELKQEFVELVDGLYVMTANLDRLDDYTRAYYGVVLNRLFWEFRHRGVRAFFILDNALRDDRFGIAMELFAGAGFKAVAPYVTDTIAYSPEHTESHSRDLKDVLRMIEEARAEGAHILYVEKDASINYLSDILAVGEELQSEYVCIFRNQPPDGISKAVWLLGSFGDILKL